MINIFETKLPECFALLGCLNKGNQQQYTLYVANMLGLSPTDKIDIIENIPALLDVMSAFESDMKLPAAMFVGYDIVEKVK